MTDTRTSKAAPHVCFQVRSSTALVSALIAAVVPLLMLPTSARAETSSWFFWSDDKPDKTDNTKKSETPAKTTQQPASKPEVGEPRPVKAPSASDNAAGGRQTNMPTTVPITGDNAAYLAFDQGQYLTALKLAEADAAKGAPEAHTLIARLYAEGLGVGRDEAKAVEWYRRATELGDIPGTFALGVMMAAGRGTAKDLNAAAKLFEKAALTGHAEANYNLGMLFLKGEGKPENPRRAAQHLQFAAEKGIAQAQYDLAALYQSGSGVDANAAEAAKWLSRAAAQGLASAEYEYAVVLLRGFGLTADEPRAVSLLSKAASKGVAGAQNRLAYLYFEGKLVEPNPIEAVKWRTIAASNGFKDDKLDAVIGKLKADDRKAGQKAAAEWLDRSQVQPGL